ncbi:MAG: hypothetical protein H7A39_00365 [Chlamydiales bacterium]|nr:hypothetical protein [Chlamydiales bacterium]
MNLPGVANPSVNKFFPINNQSVTQRVIAFVRRHPWAVGAAAAVGITTVTVLVIGIGVLGYRYNEYRKTQAMYASL